MPSWLIPLLVSLVLNVVAYLLAPKPKTPKPDAARDLEDPTAEAGRPIPVVFGTITVKGGNILWFGEKSIKVKKIRV
jgi:predicted phage tail protein